MMRALAIGLALAIASTACGSSSEEGSTQMAQGDSTATPDAATHRVVDVSVSGDAGSYTFAVTVSSPDTGCDSYADWWEVLSEDGRLLYRRILLHSHVGEQPFTRSGGPVPIAAGEVAIVRAHMNTAGYSREAMRLTAVGAPEPVELSAGFAAEVEALDPQPEGCAG